MPSEAETSRAEVFRPFTRRDRRVVKTVFAGTDRSRVHRGRTRRKSPIPERSRRTRPRPACRPGRLRTRRDRRRRTGRPYSSRRSRARRSGGGSRPALPGAGSGHAKHRAAGRSIGRRFAAPCGTRSVAQAGRRFQGQGRGGEAKSGPTGPCRHAGPGVGDPARRPGGQAALDRDPGRSGRDLPRRYRPWA